MDMTSRFLLVSAAVVGLAASFHPEAAGLPGQVTSITLSPASPVAPGTSVTVTVNASAPCGAIGINFGEGSEIVFPIFSLPLQRSHTYNTAGTFSIVATGHGNCSGQTSTSLVVRVPPTPPAPSDLVLSFAQLNPNDVLTRTQVTYRATVRNAGAAGVFDAELRVTFPDPGWSVPANGSPGAGCRPAGSNGRDVVVSCVVGSLAGGASNTLTLQMVSPPVPAGQDELAMKVLAAVSSEKNARDPNTANNQAAVLTRVVPLADLTPDMPDLPLTGTAGQDLVYVVRVKNIGDGAARNVVTRMQLPREVNFVRADASQFASCTPSGQAGQQGGQFVTCTAGTIGGGATVSARIVTHPIQGLSDGAKLLFTLGIDPDRSVRERDENNNGVAVQTTLRSPSDLEITSITIDRTGSPEPILTKGSSSFPLACAADRGIDANTTVHVRVTNHGPGQSPATFVGVIWTSGVVAATVGGDCPAGQHCGTGRFCANGDPPPAQGVCFDTCRLQGLFPGETAEVVFRVIRRRELTDFGVATADPAQHDVNDPNRSNNFRHIQ
jgi:uncharacterized repeat protein (TIGR01451 family)